MGSEVVPSPSLKLLEQFGSPVGSVILQAVTKYGVGGMVAESLHQTISDGVEVRLDRMLVVMVEDKSLCPDCRPFHSHSGAAGDEKHHNAGTVQLGRNLQPAPLGHRFPNLDSFLNHR